MGAVPSITIEEYLRGLLVNYPLPDAVINGILARRDIESGAPAFQRNAEGAEPLNWIRKRDLATADVYFAAGTLVNGGGGSKQMGNRRYTEGQIQVAEGDREYWRSLANIIYKKYGEATPEEAEIYDASGLWAGSTVNGNGWCF